VRAVVVTVVVTRGPVQWPHVRGQAEYKSGTVVHKLTMSAQIASSGDPVHRPSSSSSIVVVVAVTVVCVVLLIVVVVVTVFVFVVEVMVDRAVDFPQTPHINGQPFTTLSPTFASKHNKGPIKLHAPISEALEQSTVCGLVVAGLVVWAFVVVVVAVVALTVVGSVTPAHVLHITKHMSRTTFENAGSIVFAASQSSALNSKQPTLSRLPLQVPTVDVDVDVVVLVLVLVVVDVDVRVVVDVDVEVVVDVDVEVVVDVDVDVVVTEVTVDATHVPHKIGHVFSSSLRTAFTGVLQKAGGTPQSSTGSDCPLQKPETVVLVVVTVVVVIVVAVAVVEVRVVFPPGHESHMTKHNRRTIMENAGRFDVLSWQSLWVNSEQPSLSGIPLHVPTV